MSKSLAGFERAELMAPPESACEAWRRLYLGSLAIQLALVEYVSQPDATINGVSRILCGFDLGPRDS